MKRIALLSDTHSYLDPRFLKYFEFCDEIWHAGDIGNLEITDELEKLAPVRAVYGNIDNHIVRSQFKRDERFVLEGVEVWITHIGGYPGRYDKKVRDEIYVRPPKLFICGHSHILKVQPDPKLGLLHMNPGAAGAHGFHKNQTALRFELKDARIENLEIIDLGAKKFPSLS